MTRLFGKVSYVGIDTDPEFLYPKGSARVTFENKSSVISAVKKRFLMPAETKTRKMVNICLDLNWVGTYCIFIIIQMNIQ